MSGTVDPISAAILGLVEGVTEFIPVSSTGHLILAAKLIGATGPTADLVDVVIQVGAILAICWLYRRRIWNVVTELPTSSNARHFARNVLIAFVPSAVAGVVAHDFIKRVLFSPWVVAMSLIAGGVAILLIERHADRRDGVRAIDHMDWRLALGIGLCQILSLVPGVSRSGATIMGGIALGAERKTATEFSFFLAIPTMFAAASYDLLKNRDLLTSDALMAILTGLVVSFVTALVVVKWLIAFVSRHDFKPFGYYRIAFGFLALLVLSSGVFRG